MMSIKMCAKSASTELKPISTSRQVMAFGASLSLSVGVIAGAAWVQGNRWHGAHLSTYRIFPLFGLLAFSLLWAQYITLAVAYWRRLDRQLLRPYFETSGFFVLLAIMLHPGLLVWQLWRDGFGLPPESYIQHFVGPQLAWVALLGSVSWLIFLAYEFRRLFGDRPWWPWVAYASDIAMLAVFYHGWRLGDQLRQGWFRGVWIAYGISLVAALLYIRGNAYLNYKTQKRGK